jgi:hypothetical protein
MALQAGLWYNRGMNIVARAVLDIPSSVITERFISAMDTIIPQKLCSKCGEVKTLDAFQRDRTTFDGYYPSCKVCKHKSLVFAPVSIDSKPCTICKETKPIDAFSKNPKHPTGYRSQCKECRKNVEYARWRESHPKVYEKYTSDDIPRGFKMCMSCDEIKPSKEFFKDKVCKDGFIRYCKECCKKHRKTPTQAKKTRLKNVFNLTLEQYSAMVQSQNGLCAICKQPPLEGRSLNVDHCHRTNKVRELLCHHCNVSLGLLKEDPERIQALLDYVLKYQSEP